MGCQPLAANAKQHRLRSILLYKPEHVAEIKALDVTQIQLGIPCERSNSTLSSEGCSLGLLDLS
uniref:Uncharacterized protein n=1 Tax=Arundo donax TaxID=35708 RepID=A0A0A9DE88_ARUDO